MVSMNTTYMLQHDDTEFYRNEENFQWAQRDFLTYIMEATYSSKMELFGSMLTCLTTTFCVFVTTE